MLRLKKSIQDDALEQRSKHGGRSGLRRPARCSWQWVGGKEEQQRRRADEGEVRIGFGFFIGSRRRFDRWDCGNKRKGRKWGH
jgi:hypothetical protein